MDGGMKPRLVWWEVNYCIIQIQSGDSPCTCVTECQTQMEMCVCVCMLVIVPTHCKEAKIGCLLLAVLKAYNQLEQKDITSCYSQGWMDGLCIWMGCKLEQSI